MKITVFQACNGDSFLLETEASIALIPANSAHKINFRFSCARSRPRPGAVT